jgi:hypothetical protein
MSFCRPAIRRIALALLVPCVATLLPSSLRADSLFDDHSPAVESAVDRSATRAAREELARARLMLTRARVASKKTRSAAESDARDSTGYRSLQSAAARAISEYQQARRPAMYILVRDAEYDQLGREREAVRAEIRRVATQGKADFASVLPLARRALAAGERMTRSESIVLALDPAVEEARMAMTEAFAMLRRATMTVNQRAAERPEAAMALDDVAEARQRVTEANANLVAALKAEQAADRARRRVRNS